MIRQITLFSNKLARSKHASSVARMFPSGHGPSLEPKGHHPRRRRRRQRTISTTIYDSRNVFVSFHADSVVGASFTTRTYSSSINQNAPLSTPLDVEAFQSDLLSFIPEMADSLLENGYYTSTDILPLSTIQKFREQSIALRFEHDRFEQSYSETIDETTGIVKERFDKEGVFACEPDGGDYYDAQDLVTYMSVLLQTLPEALNQSWETNGETLDVARKAVLPTLSSNAFNAKLAVTEQGGAKYPLHVDNPQGVLVGDTRKLTCILYLNPEHDETNDGGDIRLYLPKEDGFTTVDLSPIGGRMLVFWSDEIPHEVLPTAFAQPTADKDRYALTIWIPTTNAAALHNESSRFRNLKDLVFSHQHKNPNSR